MHDNASLVMILLIVACIIVIPPVGIGLLILYGIYEWQHPAK